MTVTRRLVLGIHDHQPVGNFDHVFADAYEHAYGPFLALLERHERIRLALHHSGPLLEWIEDHRPDYLERVGRLVEAGRVELMGGAFYEPILVAIPEQDRLEQLERMSAYLEGRFGVRPRGAWLAERIWEPHLASTLARAGVEYVALDDYHFSRAGMDPAKLHGTYLTEDDGGVVRVFPISQTLRYCIPFGSVDDVRRACIEAPVPEGAALSFFDDGEKFGVWPHTYQSVYEGGWLERFFGMLSEPDSPIRTALPRELLDETPEGLVYLPSASYFEMAEWTLPAERAGQFAALVHEAEEQDRIEEQRPFLAGGIWRGFLTKYAEVNLQQKLVNRTSRRLHAATGDPAVLERARTELHRSQCNCAYWHGVFGGTYLPHLRAGIQQPRIAADALLWDGGDGVELEQTDLEVDGKPCFLVESARQLVALKPGEGAALLAWDLRDERHALHDVLTRRPEGYHAQLVPAEEAPPAEEGNIHQIVRTLPPGEKLVYDWYRRMSLLDRLLGELPTAAAMRDQEVREIGDFVAQPYQARVLEGGAPGSLRAVIHTERDGHLWWPDGGRQPLRVEKVLEVQAGPAIRVCYCWTNTGDHDVSAWWGVECNLKLLEDEGDDRRLHTPHDGAFYPMERFLDPTAAPALEVQDDALGFSVVLLADHDPRWLSFGVHTLSQSEAGVDRIYQGTCAVAFRPIELAPGASLDASFDLSIRDR